METQKGVTAAMNATSVQDLVSKRLPMTKEQFEAEKDYQAIMSIFQTMHREGLISPKEYGKINTIIAKKTGSISGSLLL